MTAVVRNGVAVDATFAEAFPMKATRLLVTAHTPHWAEQAGLAATGFVVTARRRPAKNIGNSPQEAQKAQEGDFSSCDVHVRQS